jgi:hypothetical protein
VERVTVERESIDARRKPNIEYVYHVRFSVSEETPHLRQLVEQKKIVPYRPRPLAEVEPHIALPERPIIVGFGPAGMFAALYLARKGYRPIVYERGEEVSDRVQSINRLWDDGVLNPESNMQFGEGGAGTFSDGKLSTGKSSALDRLILTDLVEAGAPDAILYSNKPHIGTDYLRRVVVRIRQQIESLGGEVVFGAKVTGLAMEGNAVTGVTVNGATEGASAVILAIGHSARDTVAMLRDCGVAMTLKAFAVGTRIEHPAGLINERQYGPEGAEILPAADYKLTHRYRGNSVYSFCMCPGGQVVCASSEPQGQVTNGMSRFAREMDWSNSAIIVGIDPGRYGLGSPLEAMAFQRELERRAFELGGGAFYAPAQRAADFVRGVVSSDLPETSYRPGVRSAQMEEVLPQEVAASIKSGLSRFDRIIPGFIEHGVLIGMESRTTSPVRIERDDDFRSVSTEGLYPLGEGAGYAGGIMTCARDAVRFTRRVKPRG